MEAKAAQAISTVQVAVETMLERSKQIQDLQKQLQAMMVSLEVQRLYTEGLEGDLQKTRQRLLNAESTVKATKSANEVMQKTVDYWSTFYEEENAARFADPAVFSNSILASTSQRQSIPKQAESQPSPSISNISLQPQASTSNERPQVSNFALNSRPQDNFAFNSQSGGEMHTETSLAGWHGSNGAGLANQTSATFNITIKL